MKVPFGHLLGPFLKHHNSQIQSFCKPCLFGSQVYLTAFSISALIITLSDLLQIVNKGCLPPSPLKSLNPRVCPAFLKNAKLIGTGININTYFLLIVGVIFKYPVFLMPYLLIQFFNIAFFSILLSIMAIMKWKCLEKKNILLFGFMVHNWLQVFCFFRSLLHPSDF